MKRRQKKNLSIILVKEKKEQSKALSDINIFKYKKLLVNKEIKSQCGSKNNEIQFKKKKKYLKLF